MQNKRAKGQCFGQPALLLPLDQSLIIHEYESKSYLIFLELKLYLNLLDFLRNPSADFLLLERSGLLILGNYILIIPVVFKKLRKIF